mgnify:CR=1 FL=1|tara:strand:- start:49610 stop:50587 length:978 start_codon:yes stop_codon:yes gene_type:complete
MTEGAVNSLHTFQIDIVHGCQLRCVGCPNSTIMDKVRRVDPEDFSACLDNVDVQYIKHLRLFNFGEPLLHTDLTGIFRILARQPWKAEETEISTNAQWCDWEDLERALALGVLDRLVVSCDGDGTPEQYEQLRPPAKWDKLIEFLERAADIRERVAPGLQLVTRNIIEDQAAMRRWEQVLLPRGWTPEFRDWKVLPEAQQNRTGRPLEVPDDICTFVAPSEHFQEQYHGGLHQLYVDAQGTVVPCCAHPSAANLGSLRQSKVSELMHNEARQAFIHSLATNRKNVPVCNVCEFGPPEAPGKSFAQLDPEKARTTDDTVQIVNISG